MGLTRKQQVDPNYISVKVCDELFALIVAESEAEGCPMIDVVVKAVAKHFKRPDLGYVPRKPPGVRPKRPVTA